MENDKELGKGKYPPDIFWPSDQRVLVELDRIKRTKYYELTEAVYTTFVFDRRHGVIGWWDSNIGKWLEIWAIRIDKQGPTERWTYFPETFEGELSPLPSYINLEKEPPDLVSVAEVPYNVLKTIAMLTEKMEE